MKRLKVYMVIVVVLALGLAGCPKSGTSGSRTTTSGRTTADGNTAASQRDRQGTTTSRSRTAPQPNQPGTTGQQTPATGGGGGTP